jgi:hypothetical protein
MHNYSFASAPPLSDLSCEPKDGVVLCCWWDCSQRQWEMNRRKAPRAHLPPSPSDTHRHPPTSRTPHTPTAPCGGVCRCRAPRTRPAGEGRPGNPRRSPPRAYSGPYPGRAPSTRTSPLAAPCPAQSSILPARQHQGMFTPPLVRTSESERECDGGGGSPSLPVRGASVVATGAEDRKSTTSGCESDVLGRFFVYILLVRACFTSNTTHEMVK